MLDELLADYSTPEQILGERLLKQLTKRLLERALQAELSHHLETEAQVPPAEENRSNKRRNSAMDTPLKRSKQPVENWHSRFPVTVTAPLSRFWYPKGNGA